MPIYQLCTCYQPKKLTFSASYYSSSRMYKLVYIYWSVHVCTCEEMQIICVERKTTKRYILCICSLSSLIYPVRITICTLPLTERVVARIAFLPIFIPDLRSDLINVCDCFSQLMRHCDTVQNIGFFLVDYTYSVLLPYSVCFPLDLNFFVDCR